MDIYIERNVKVKLELTEEEFFALKDITSLAQEYADQQGFPLNEKSATLIGKIKQTYEGVRN